MNIKKKILQAVDRHGLDVSYHAAELIAEALVAELAKENKPVYYLWENKYGDPQQMLSSNSGPHPEYVITALCTIPPTAEQIEQETAEACAKVCANLTYPYSGQVLEQIKDTWAKGTDDAAEAIRSGAWKEYK